MDPRQRWVRCLQRSSAGVGCPGGWVMAIVPAESVTGFLHEVVGDAMKARRVDATGGAQTYLVSLLADFAKPDSRAEQTLDRPLAFLLDEALHTPLPAERFDKLRVLGDG